MKNLNEKTVLVGLNISQWTARKYDRKVTAQVARDYQVNADSGRYNKVLIALDTINQITKVVSQARTYHYDHTLPWSDNGSRILPTRMYLDYTGQMRQYKDQYEKAVKDFLIDYPNLVQDAQIRLNSMYNHADYPDEQAIANKFAFSVSTFPVPDGGDFRIDLPVEELVKIQTEVELKVQDSFQAAQKDLFQRLYQAVSSMADRLSDSKAIFRDTLVGNLADLCMLLQSGLNVTDNADLESMRQDIETKLTAYTPDTLRDNAEIRGQVAKEAELIRQKLDCFI